MVKMVSVGLPERMAQRVPKVQMEGGEREGERVHLEVRVYVAPMEIMGLVEILETPGKRLGSDQTLCLS